MTQNGDVNFGVDPSQVEPEKPAIDLNKLPSGPSWDDFLHPKNWKADPRYRGRPNLAEQARQAGDRATSSGREAVRPADLRNLPQGPGPKPRAKS